MKVQSFVLCFLLTLLSVSCIREEAPNAEADILSCTVDGDILKAEPEIDNEPGIHLDSRRYYQAG